MANYQDRDFIIWLYGDSLALPRPGYVKHSERYIAILRSFWQTHTGCAVEVYDRARGGATVRDLYSQYMQDSSYFDIYPAVFIMHCGICDCAPRPVSRGLRYLIGKTPHPIRNYLIKLIHKNRSFIIKHIHMWRVVSPKKFRIILYKWLQELIKNNTRIYVINIAPTNIKTENHSPGLSNSIKMYNQIIYETIEKIKADGHGENIFLIDIYELINSANLVPDYLILEDGHHITSLAHKLISNQIILFESNFN